MPSMFFNSEDRAKFVLSEWLFAPARSTSTEINYYLREQLLSAPGAALMGSFCSLLVLLAAYYRSGAPVMLTFVTIEIVLSLGRLAEWGTRDSDGETIQMVPSTSVGPCCSRQDGARFKVQ